MATSRTGTTAWKRIREQALKDALERGLMHCPRCRVGLDWEYSLRPNSPEVDHIKAHSQGGADALENVRVICRRCNQELGARLKRPKAKPIIETENLPTSNIW